MKTNNKTAISLIVLVITIIVLSILAATVIISLSNTNIMGQASETVFKQDMANYKETYEMYVTNKLAENSAFDRSTLNVTSEDDEFEEIFGNVPDKYKEGLKVVNGKLIYVTEDETEKNILKDLAIASSKPIISKWVNGVPIPNGFYYVGGEKSTGLVISDDARDENEGVDFTCVGNQFVWVPVEGYEKSGNTTQHAIYTGTDKARTVNLYESFTNKFKRGSLNTSVTPYQMTGTPVSTSYTEPYSSGYATESDEYYAMMESVQEYGGFYIGRFEAGDGSATSARTAATEAKTVVSQKGVYVYNYVPWGSGMTSIGTTGAVYLSQHMYENHESVVSTLCYGVQWDATMNFVSDSTHNISNSTSWGNYKNNTETGAGVLQKTGYSESWKAKNIYDLAGNVYEWTMEAISSYGRLKRGGYYDHIGSGDAATYRFFYYPDDANGSDGFRPTLYIKVE